MARPPSTYEGRTSTGKPIRSATFTASSTERAVPFAGCVMPRRSASASKRPRSSAMSIESGAVPRMGTPAASSGLVKRRGVCPPSWTTTPLGRSHRTISSTSSNVSGSKYSLSEMSKSVDTVSDKLYFEPLTFEDVLEIVRWERPKGVVVQFGGQTPLQLTKPLEAARVPVLGTSPDAIDIAEDRERFEALADTLGVTQPPNGIARSVDEAVAVAQRIGLPVLGRPCYGLGGGPNDDV